MKTIAIIANSKNIKAHQLKGLLSDLLPNDYVVVDRYTTHHGHAIELTQEVIEENDDLDLVIAVGGDGTMNEVVNGLMLAPSEKREQIAIGLYPMGTGNDFARVTKIAKSVKELANLIVNKKCRRIDLGLVDFKDKDGNKQKRYFNNIAEIGVGAKTVQIVNGSKKRLGSTLTFFLGVVRAFVGYKQQKIKLRADDFQWSGKIVEVCIANGCFFGSGIGIAPDAKIDDGQLGLVIVGNIKIVHFLWFLPKLRKLKKIKHPEVHYKNVNSCEVEGQKEEYPFEMDGENVGFTPFSVNVVPKAIRFLGE